MTVPAGYTELGFVGFTDRGSYNPTTTYVKNDLVSYKNTIWKCVKDDTRGIEPASTATENWESWIRGVVDTGTQPITTTEWSPILSDNTWKQISDASRLGKAKELWNIGDAVYTPIIAGTHEAWIMVSRIAGFDHDNLAYEEGKAGITFVSNNVVYPGLAMGVMQADGGYTKSNIFNEMEVIERYLTQDLRDVLKSVKKKVLQKSADTVPEEFIAKLFLPSTSEMYSATSLSYISPNFRLEGDTYELFNTTTGSDVTGTLKSNSYIIKYGSGTSTASHILRTPSTNANAYGGVGTSGTSTTMAYSSGSYYKFMFCV